jgi:hypothetical protein
VLFLRTAAARGIDLTAPAGIAIPGTLEKIDDLEVEIALSKRLKLPVNGSAICHMKTKRQPG